MDVRPARPTDAPLALTLALDESAHVVRGFGWPATNRVWRSILRTLLPPLAMPGRSWIACDGGSAALLEAQPRRYVIGWDVTRLAVRGERERVMGPVLQAATEHLRSRGVPRLFARCDERATEALKAVGFQALAREYVLVGPSEPAGEEGALPIESRYRMPQDAWPLHQLESDVTPPLVRQLEGLTSLDWSSNIKGLSEIVVERDGRMVAWVGWGLRLAAGYTQVGLLVHPDHRDLASDLLTHALRSAPAEGRLVARVRDYQPDVLRAFTDAGFTLAAEEILMIKHARVVPAVARQRMKVAAVPSIQAFNQRLVGISLGAQRGQS